MSLTLSPLAADHLRPEEVAESLRRQELLTREERREVEWRRPVDVGRKLKDFRATRFLPLLVMASVNLPGGRVTLFGWHEFSSQRIATFAR